MEEYARRERVVREAAERWQGRPLIRFGVELSYERRLEPTIRAYLATHPYDFVLGSIHLTPRHPLGRYDEAGIWCAGKTHREASEWYWEEAEAAIRSELFDAFAHLDVVKRYLLDHLGPFPYEEHGDLYDRLLVALIETGTALEVNSSGLRQGPRESYPPPVVVERFRQLGGTRVTVGSDAHRAHTFGSGLPEAYAYIEAAGMQSLSFRRGAGRIEIPLPARSLSATQVDGT